MRRLIVTADDVGLHPAMTDGAIEAHRRGVVTACSVIVSGADFERAARELTALPGLDAGVHLTLVESNPVAPAASVPSLLENGALRSAWRKFVFAWLAGSVRPEEVELELRSQIERAQAQGIVIRHLNGHQHLHLLPGIWTIVQRLAVELNIPYVRIANDRGGRVSLARRVPVSVLSALGRRAKRKAQVATNDRSIGIAEAGALDEEGIVALLAEVEGITELVTHPAVADAALESVYGWGYRWSEELRALCSDQVRSAIREQGIELIRPRDINRS